MGCVPPIKEVLIIIGERGATTPLYCGTSPSAALVPLLAPPVVLLVRCGESTLAPLRADDDESSPGKKTCGAAVPQALASLRPQAAGTGGGISVCGGGGKGRGVGAYIMLGDDMCMPDWPGCADGGAK